MNEITQHDIGLFRRELRDVRAVVANIDHRTRKLIEPVSVHRPAGVVARYAACKLIAIKEKRTPEAVAKQHFGRDTELARAR